MTAKKHLSYWEMVWAQFRTHPIGVAALLMVGLFALVGLYAPFLASSKPLLSYYDGKLYFPLFRYLFYSGFFTKRLDIFFNLLMFTLPLGFLAYRYAGAWAKFLIAGLTAAHLGLFVMFAFGCAMDPASDADLNAARQAKLQAANGSDTDPLLRPLPDPYLDSWDFELDYSNDYAKYNMVLRDRLRREQNERFQKYAEVYAAQELLELGSRGKELGEEELADRLAIPTLWHVDQQNDREEMRRQGAIVSQLEERALAAKKQLPELTYSYEHALASGDQDKITVARKKLSTARRLVIQHQEAQSSMQYIIDRRAWLDQEQQKLHAVIMPFIRPFHWEDDAGGEQDVNQYVSWWELTRINRKDLMAGLIFGVRVSLVVGITSVFIALIIGIPIGAAAGFYGGKWDIFVCRWIEIWESMPVLFMLLMVVAVTQNKSIFLVIAVVGIFGWTGFSRFIRGEFFKQRSLPYVEACRALGYSHSRIIFSHILPNAIPPLLTLLPFAIMGAITSEAGLSFLGLGEEGSCSWGVLMDEGRTAFPGESYLLWPPALMLTILLVAIALVGDAMRDALDPKMRS